MKRDQDTTGSELGQLADNLSMIKQGSVAQRGRPRVDTICSDCSTSLCRGGRV